MVSSVLFWTATKHWPNTRDFCPDSAHLALRDSKDMTFEQTFHLGASVHYRASEAAHQFLAPLRK